MWAWHPWLPLAWCPTLHVPGVSPSLEAGWRSPWSPWASCSHGLDPGGPQGPAVPENLESEGVQADPGMGTPRAHEGQKGDLGTHSPQRPWQVAEGGVE